MLKLHRKPFGVAIISLCKTSNSIENGTQKKQLTTLNKETQRAKHMMYGEVLCLLGAVHILRNTTSGSRETPPPS